MSNPNGVSEMSWKTSTIPYTPTASGWASVHPRQLTRIQPHPILDKAEIPPLPTPSRPSIFHTTTHGVYRLTTHLVPAAYPRLAPEIPLPELPPYNPAEPPADRHAKLETLVRQVAERQHAYHEGVLNKPPGETLLWNCVNRYARTSRKTGITLFLAHANGFHKETWETMLQGLLDTPAGEIIDEVWAWEAVQHGDAAVVNGKNLSGIFDWLDNTRDIANFFLHYLPEQVGGTVPTRLPRLPASVAKDREACGYLTRSLVVVGHSFGGCTAARAAIDYPKLFSSIVLVDPVIHRPPTFLPGTDPLALGAFARRDRWPSRKEALVILQNSPFFGAWHPDVLKHYVDYALIDDGEGGVKLKMSGLQEGLSFMNRIPSHETWELVERLDTEITLRWVVPEKPMSTSELTYERVWRRPSNSTNIVFHFAGHLIVQEAPLELACDLSDFLLRKHGPMKSYL